MLLFIVLEHMLALAGFVMLFDYTGVRNMNFPFQEAIRYVYLGFLPNIETFFFPFWLISSIIRFAVYLYCAAMLFGFLFKIVHFEYALPIMATLTLAIGMMPENPTILILFAHKKLLVLITPFFICFPILLWIIAKFKGVFKNAQSKTN